MSLLNFIIDGLTSLPGVGKSQSCCNALFLHRIDGDVVSAEVSIATQLGLCVRSFSRSAVLMSDVGAVMRRNRLTPHLFEVLIRLRKGPMGTKA